MRKYHDIFKEKQARANHLRENKILVDFKNVYSVLLEKYSITDFYTLNEEEQITFLAELNSFWDESAGISKKGNKFLTIRSDVLSETSTTLQKKNYLKDKTFSIINETLRQSEIKYKIYDIIDEMYNEIKAENVNDILSTDNILKIVNESFSTSLNDFILNMKHELNESQKK